ncbi:MAG: hypothetical protein GXO77_02545 [Calditrichaeota bacterium]|nr:hypothetical protein [Calditrichota bacterium]
MSLKQKIKKISRLSFNEIVFRAKEQLYLIKEKEEHPAFLEKVYQADFDFFAPQFRGSLELFKGEGIWDLLKNQTFMRRTAEPLDEAKKRRYLTEFKEEYEVGLKRADAFCENRFAFLGAEFQLPDPIPWQSDPLSLKPFPQGFYRDIDIFTNENPGDVKHVWEVNRLQFVIELAKAYYLSGEEKYRSKLENLLRDWYEKNPYQTGIAWASALEVGVRAMSLIWILYFYLSAKKQDAEVLRIILKLLYLSGKYLNNHLSLYFSPYNHLIGETAALFAVGYLFPGFKGASLWAQKALTVLEDQAEKQFHEDGGSVEQAAFYHHFTLGFYLLTISFLKHNGNTPSERILRRTEKALEFAMFMTRPDGTLPYIGDIDDARSIYFTNPTNWNFRSYQCFGAVWFNRPDMKYAAQKLREDAFWMLSEKEREQFVKLKAQPPQKKVVFFNDTGYYVFRSGFGVNDHFSFMDAGPLAAGVFKDETPSAAHGHADLLSVEIAPFGESMLIDAGFSNYRGEYDWHAYFRSTAAHNTVVINGQSQAKQTGILKWSFAPDFEKLKAVQQDWYAGVCAQHYGYARLNGSPVHRRYFAFVDQMFWIVLDVLFAKSPVIHNFEWNFHFNEQVILSNGEPDLDFLAKGEKSTLRMLFCDDSDLTWNDDIVQGGKSPADGWISPTYRARRPAPLLRLQTKAKLPLTVCTLFLPGQKENSWQITKIDNGFILTDKKNKYSLSLIKNDPVLLKLEKTEPQVRMLCFMRSGEYFKEEK